MYVCKAERILSVFIVCILVASSGCMQQGEVEADTAVAQADVERDAMRSGLCHHAIGKRLCVSQEITIQMPPASVWKVVGNFTEWDAFLSSAYDSHQTGFDLNTIRFLEIGGYGVVADALQSRSDRFRSLTYRTEWSNFPVKNHESMVVVRDVEGDSNAAEVIWTGLFEANGVSAAEAQAFMDEFYAAGLADLQAYFTTVLDVTYPMPAPAEDVWEIIRDFNGWGVFMPAAIGTSRLVEANGHTVRVIQAIPELGGYWVMEEMDCLDDEAMSVTYSIVGSPLPLVNYSATMIVIPVDETQSMVHWYSSFGAPEGASFEESRALMEDFYYYSLATLASLF